MSEITYEQYTTDGRWGKYDIPELLNFPEESDWDKVLRGVGFEAVHDFEDYSGGLGMKVWRHPTHGFLVEVWSRDNGIICSVICKDPPSLMCFLRDFAPVFQMDLSFVLKELIETINTTILDPNHGIDVVKQTLGVRRREEDELWRKQQERKKGAVENDAPK
jgi:hypothetical protein